eukprot:CAMPEP_0178800274 /NCGR_PEP_ID=MMETSP0745-20121128/12743_1 /TAXON_ID=913974 /ORGANISM="Nitzschia punctata, Strain CCMP561" /LENGTH=528 /DNA_ID=CAMNT_0020459065 /DNA_START=13 /DNA_END=1599 /DNA_ORIENTATION=+
MRFFTAVVLATVSPCAVAHNGHHHDHNDLKPHTHVAYHHVESACAADVEALCGPKNDLISKPHPTSGDPFLDWILFAPASVAPPSEMQDLNLFMDRMFDSVFEPRSPQISIVWFSEALLEEPHLVVDSAVAKLAADKEPEEIPQLAHELQKYGEGLLHDADVHGERHRMARRLTEMDTKKIQQQVSLPFGSAKNNCLREVFESHKVSRECAHSIHVLERTFVLENELDRRQGVFIGMMWIYIAALGVLMILVARNYRSRRARRRLKQKILLAVYSNPVIREQVEEELGESVGDLPPLSYHVMRLISAGGQDLKRRLRCLRRVNAVFLTFLMTLVFVAPFWVLPICIMVTLVRVAQLCFVNNELEAEDCTCCCCAASPGMQRLGLLTEEQAAALAAEELVFVLRSVLLAVGLPDAAAVAVRPAALATAAAAPAKTEIEDDCTCCCCAATPSMAKAGLLTEEQACCGCCKGTGKCSAACASCCGGDVGCCCGCCCSCCSSGDCCQMKGRGKKHVVSAQKIVYEGVPLQVV